MRKEELPELSGFTMVMREKYSQPFLATKKVISQEEKPLKDIFNRIQNFPHLFQVSAQLPPISNVPCKSASHITDKRTSSFRKATMEYQGSVRKSGSLTEIPG